ncbi:hypothetical protein QTP88_013999 [Uroleucon formosanum]
MTPPKLFSPLTDRIKFHNLVEQEINLNFKLKTYEDIDNAVDKFTSIIQTAAWESQSYSNSPQIPKNPLLPQHIRSLIVEKRKARARYQTSHLPSHKIIYNKLANSLKKYLSKYKSDTLEQKLSNISSSDGSLWKETNTLLRYKASLPPLTKNDTTIAVTNEDKAEVFRQHLSEIFKPHPDIFNPILNAEITQYLDSPMPLYLPEKSFTPNEIKSTIQKYSLKKSPGFDLITAEVARCLPKKAILFLTHLFNSILRLSYFPLLWKFSNIILIPKPDKPLDLPSSYRPISLLPFLAKVLERLILRRLLPYIVTNKILPNSQFGFRSMHSTIHQGGILSPLLFNIYTSDQPVSQNTIVADYADDKAIISIDKNPQIASSNLQIHLNLMSEWYIKWRIKPNPSKSVHTTFTLCHSLCPNVSLQNVPIPTSNTVRYLGLNLDKRLTWNAHIRIKRLALNVRLCRLGPLLSNNKQSKLKVKVLMYKTLLKPMWTYGLQLWGIAKVSNTNKIQQFQNIAFRKITNAPPFVSNYTLHKDLAMKTVKEEAVDFYKRFHNRLQTHQNPLIKSLYTHTIPGNPRRRLKRNWCRDLL